MALEARIRSKARRLGLKAKHHRGIGGWSATDIQTGEVVIERCFDYQLEEHLDNLIKEKPADTGMSAGLEMPSSTKSKAR